MTHVGLVLGAGGLAGHAFHAGVLRALDESGWDARLADLVVGTSAGAGVAAYLRAGVPPSDLAARIGGRAPSPEGAALLSRLPPPPPSAGRPALPWPPWPQSVGLLGARARRPWTLRPGHLLASLSPEGTTSTDVLAERIRLLHPGHWPDRPVWICAVRLRDGARVVLGRDAAPEPDLATAVAASSAIPGWFEPVAIGRERYVDGAVHSPTNADLLRGLALDVAVVSSPMSSAVAPTLVPPSNPARALHAAMLERELRALRDDGLPVLVVQPSRQVLDAVGLDAMNPRRMADIAERAYEAALEAIAASDVRLG